MPANSASGNSAQTSTHILPHHHHHPAKMTTTMQHRLTVTTLNVVTFHKQRTTTDSSSILFDEQQPHNPETKTQPGNNERNEVDGGQQGWGEGVDEDNKSAQGRDQATTRAHKDDGMK
ncbi:hypothetical protein K443DRAFT_4677 [Laccaria amethystina LaAM-08-1]|uniref:Uncharacterized protein n=1 Tax=Laccaria amethystina LaAM-08-1 TaxID=1095629 RepID=A0A0C9Y8L0_9AGAR|nr:hypothetical protein K443DRAFT_4677 [Laccaria amethystina LaAM-08-1]